MLLLITLLPLASVLQHSLGENYRSPVGEITEKQKKEIVDQHNAIRSRVMPTARNMLKIKWSEKAYEGAKKWVAKCRPHISPVEDRIMDGIEYGENSMQSGFLWSWSDAIDMWYQERTNFLYGVGAIDRSRSTDVYTQLVWYKTNGVGCALAYCSEDELPFFFYVCRYSPAGNVGNSIARPYKEGPSCEDCPNNCENNLCTNPCKYVDNIKGCDKLVGMFEKVDGKCGEKWLQEECSATCSCPTEII